MLSMPRLPHWSLVIRHWSFRAFGAAALFALAPALSHAAASSAPSEPTPQGPVEPLSPVRARIVLNGLWSFQPAVDAAAREPSTDWGAIWVPGSWLDRGHWDSPRLPSVARKGTGPLWQKLTNDLPSAWYERTFDLPADWQGHRVELDLRRVSTDAQVWLNGRQLGEVRWPFGRVDLTPAVRPGKNTLRLLVVASTEGAEQIDYMGYATEARSLARLHAAGLVGDVVLESSPTGGVISDVFAKPSVRRSELGVEVELDRVPRPGPVTFRLSARRADAPDAVVFSAETTVQAAAGKQTFDLAFPWTDSARWDLDTPVLHILRVEASGPDAGVADTRDQRFGFREFWIEDRRLILNGIPLNLRPTLAPGRLLNGTPENHAGLIAGMKGAGFNLSQVWPQSVESRRGQYHFWDHFYAAASEAGWPVIGAWPGLNDFFQDARGNATWAARRAEYAALADAVIRRVRNEPSILLWGTTGNYFNHGGDQDPRNLGRDYRAAAGLRHARDAEWREALAIVRKTDPSRPVFTHAGNTYGDLYSTNHYLNLLPLQEREEWLAEWSRTGEKPFLAVEMGTPLYTNFHRGRNGYGGAVASEPLLTEFLAGFFGPEAYRAESLDYRRQVVAMKHQQGQKWELMQGEPIILRHPQFQELQSRFIRHTWRAWRADGVSAGMIPWASEAQLWRHLAPADSAEPPAAAFVPGRLGPYVARPDLRSTAYLQPAGGWSPLPGGQTLAEVNGPTLAWIAGGPGPENLHDKAHTFVPGESVAKQLVVLNDLRASADYTVAWTATLDGREIARGESSGRLAPADQARVPLAFTAPEVPAAARASGEITLRATIGGRAHADTFSFRVFGAPEPSPAATWLVFDPAGDTSAYLRAQGLKVAAWNGQPARDAILALGRRALSSGTPLPGDLRAFVAAGGRLVVFGQDPDWYRSIGLRVSRQVLREVFPVDPQHPLFAGLTAADLGNWRGAGTLVEARPTYAKDRIPTHGWRWGNRHSVTSAAIEKPHRAGWRPLLECDFDLAYSPLLELDLGAGRAWLCTLDFEARGERDPAADELFRRFARHVATSEARPRATRTVYVGDAEGARLLRDLAVEFTQESRPPSASRGALLIVGNGANISPSTLTQWAAAGGNVFVLPGQKGGEDHFGASIVLAKRFGGSLTPPPSPLGDGLSLSDLRLRSTADFRIVGTGGAARPYADGLLGVQRPGNAGWIVHSQLNPRFADLEAKPYFRYTAWRLTRANAQLLANLGATFTADAQFFAPRIERIGLAGEWRAKLTAPLPQNDWRNPQRDPGPSALARAAARPGFDASAWDIVRLPGYWKPALDEADGEAVFTRSIRIPADWRGQVLLLSLGRVDNFDQVFINGVLVGQTSPKADDPKFNPWNQLREYRITADQISSTDLTITVRVFDQDSGGGIHGRDDEMFLRVLDPSIRQERTFYSPDYREDFELGDDPHRYYRW